MKSGAMLFLARLYSGSSERLQARLQTFKLQLSRCIDWEVSSSTSRYRVSTTASVSVSPSLPRTHNSVTLDPRGPAQHSRHTCCSLPVDGLVVHLKDDVKPTFYWEPPGGSQCWPGSAASACRRVCAFCLHTKPHTQKPEEVLPPPSLPPSIPTQFTASAFNKLSSSSSSSSSLSLSKGTCNPSARADRRHRCSVPAEGCAGPGRHSQKSGY